MFGAQTRTEDRASASIGHSPVQGSAERTVIHPSLGARRLTRDGRRARERQEQHERTDESSHICSGKWLKGRHAGCGVESTFGPDAAREGGGGRRRRTERFRELCRARACASDVCDAATNQRRLRLHVQGRRRNTVKKAEPPDARENEKIFKRSNRSRTVRETDFQPRMVVPKIGESR